MRTALAVILLLLFSWNSVLGGMDALVLCLHSEGDAHVELMGKNAPEAKTDCVGSETSFDNLNCPPCTDLVLESADLGPTRAHELASVKVPLPLVSSSPEQPSVSALRPGLEVANSHPTRGPPDLVRTSELISRIIVLRL